MNIKAPLKITVYRSPHKLFKIGNNGLEKPVVWSTGIGSKMAEAIDTD